MKLFDLRTMPLVHIALRNNDCDKTYPSDSYTAANLAHLHEVYMRMHGNVSINVTFTDSAQSLTALVWAVQDFCAAVAAAKSDAALKRVWKAYEAKMPEDMDEARPWFDAYDKRKEELGL